MAAQLSATNAPSQRGLSWCNWRANISLPTPDSPLISTVAGVDATRARAWVAALKVALAPISVSLAVLPGWLAAISKLLPVTYAVRAFQLAIHKGAGFQTIKSDLLALTGFNIVLIPASVWLFSLAVGRARKAGTLGEY